MRIHACAVARGGVTATAFSSAVQKKKKAAHQQQQSPPQSPAKRFHSTDIYITLHNASTSFAASDFDGAAASASATAASSSSLR
jgi:hypothetical protein